MERISHATSKQIDLYKVYLDGKEFKVKVTSVQKHHKDYQDVLDIEVTQVPNQDDRCKVIDMINDELNKEIKK